MRPKYLRLAVMGNHKRECLAQTTCLSPHKNHRPPQGLLPPRKRPSQKLTRSTVVQKNIRAKPNKNKCHQVHTRQTKKATNGHKRRQSPEQGERKPSETKAEKRRKREKPDRTQLVYAQGSIAKTPRPKAARNRFRPSLTDG